MPTHKPFQSDIETIRKRARDAHSDPVRLKNRHFSAAGGWTFSLPAGIVGGATRPGPPRGSGLGDVFP